MESKKPLMSRRALLKSVAVLAATVAAAPVTAQQNRKKPQPGMRIRTREEVGYRDEPYLGRTCSRCVLYAGDGKCVILSEPVSPEGWCTQWVPNTVG